MSLSLQLKDARADDGIRNVSGVCSSSTQFASQINSVTRQLMKRGSWFGLEVVVRFCIYGCSITLPRYVGSILGARLCSDQIDVKNHWYSIMGSGRCDDGHVPMLVDDGQAPCYNEISGTVGKRVAYHVTKNEDVGKTIIIHGTAYGGQPLQRKTATGWVPGVILTAIKAGGWVQGVGGGTLPAMTSPSQLITKITHVIRDATQGMAYLYEYGPDANGTNALRDIATYEPNETNPMYRRMRIRNYTCIPGTEDSDGRTRKQIELMVKLEYIPVENDYDFLLIDDLDALAYGIQARKRDEAGKPDEAEAFWAKAIRELNYNDRSKQSGQQTVVRVRTMGSNLRIYNPI